jgi:hypothetical protein
LSLYFVSLAVTHEHDIPIEDVEDLIGKVVEGAVIIIAASAVASVIKRLAK